MATYLECIEIKPQFSIQYSCIFLKFLTKLTFQVTSICFEPIGWACTSVGAPLGATKGKINKKIKKEKHENDYC